MEITHPWSCPLDLRQFRAGRVARHKQLPLGEILHLDGTEHIRFTRVSVFLSLSKESAEEDDEEEFDEDDEEDDESEEEEAMEDSDGEQVWSAIMKTTMRN